MGYCELDGNFYPFRTRKIVASHQFHVGFLQQRHPELCWIAGMCTQQLILRWNWQVIIYNDLSGYAIHVHFNCIFATWIVHRHAVLVFRINRRSDQRCTESLLIESSNDQCRKEWTIADHRLPYADPINKFILHNFWSLVAKNFANPLPSLEMALLLGWQLQKTILEMKKKNVTFG